MQIKCLVTHHPEKGDCKTRLEVLIVNRTKSDKYILLPTNFLHICGIFLYFPPNPTHEKESVSTISRYISHNYERESRYMNVSKTCHQQVTTMWTTRFKTQIVSIQNLRENQNKLKAIWCLVNVKNTVWRDMEKKARNILLSQEMKKHEYNE